MFGFSREVRAGFPLAATHVLRLVLKNITIAAIPIATAMNKPVEAMSNHTGSVTWGSVDQVGRRVARESGMSIMIWVIPHI